MIIISFLFFLSVFVAIGVFSVRYSKSSTKDYLLAGQTIKPWLAALSAVATNNSGYMFVGMIGFTYLYGLSSIWMMIGWIVGGVPQKQKSMIKRFILNCCKAVGKMVVGPPKSAVRSRFQTTPSGCY